MSGCRPGAAGLTDPIVEDGGVGTEWRAGGGLGSAVIWKDCEGGFFGDQSARRVLRCENRERLVLLCLFYHFRGTLMGGGGGGRLRD